MARDFNGTTGYLGANSAVLSAPPLTVAAFAKQDATGTTRAIFGLGRSSTTTPLFFMGVLSSNKPFMQYRDDDSFGFLPTGATDFGTSGYRHVAATVSSNGQNGEIFLDGVSDGAASDAAADTNVTWDRTAIGALTRTSTAIFWDGPIAEVGIWNVVLSSAEIASLAAGFSPKNIRPQNLTAYWPVLGRNDPEQDIMGTLNLTLNGTATAAAHAPVLYAGASPLRYPATAVVGGPAIAPLAVHHMNQMRA